MEVQGLPKVSLYDQRAALQWIQDYVHLVGGDNGQVSAWGESVGAGFIFHQLTAFGGTQDPLFSKAMLQSPAFNLNLIMKGAWRKLSRSLQPWPDVLARQGAAYLRVASMATLESANIALNNKTP